MAILSFLFKPKKANIPFWSLHWPLLIRPSILVSPKGPGATHCAKSGHASLCGPWAGTNSRGLRGAGGSRSLCHIQNPRAEWEDWLGKDHVNALQCFPYLFWNGATRLSCSSVNGVRQCFWLCGYGDMVNAWDWNWIAYHLPESATCKHEWFHVF